MDEIDTRKERNGVLFKWDNARRWSRYEVIQWLHDIGFKNAKYVNKMHSVGVNGQILMNDLTVDSMVSGLGISNEDAVLIEKCIFILKNLSGKVSGGRNVENDQNMNEDEKGSEKVGGNELRFYQEKCEHLNRELVRMRKIEQMFKKNRRETESRLKQLECNLYFGSLSTQHLMDKFDIDQLFEIQSAYHKSLINIQQCIQSKVKTMDKRLKK